MNNIKLKGILKNIEFSHEIDGIEFNKADLICKREDGQEDVINLKFKSFCNPYKNNDTISLEGNVRSFSEKISENKNKVNIYVFTYFTKPEEEQDINNYVEMDGRICKIDGLRVNKNHKHNIHFILANNILPSRSNKRIDSYIPCIAWGRLAKELSELKVSDKIQIKGELHSREHKKIHENGEIEFRVAHELLITEYQVIN